MRFRDSRVQRHDAATDVPVDVDTLVKSRGTRSAHGSAGICFNCGKGCTDLQSVDLKTVQKSTSRSRDDGSGSNAAARSVDLVPITGAHLDRVAKKGMETE